MQQKEHENTEDMVEKQTADESVEIGGSVATDNKILLETAQKDQSKDGVQHQESLMMAPKQEQLGERDGEKGNESEIGEQGEKVEDSTEKPETAEGQEMKKAKELEGLSEQTNRVVVEEDSQQVETELADEAQNSKKQKQDIVEVDQKKDEPSKQSDSKINHQSVEQDSNNRHQLSNEPNSELKDEPNSEPNNEPNNQVRYEPTVQQIQPPSDPSKLPAQSHATDQPSQDDFNDFGQAVLEQTQLSIGQQYLNRLPDYSFMLVNTLL